MDTYSYPIQGSVPSLDSSLGSQAVQLQAALLQQSLAQRALCGAASRTVPSSALSRCPLPAAEHGLWPSCPLSSNIFWHHPTPSVRTDVLARPPLLHPTASIRVHCPGTQTCGCRMLGARLAVREVGQTSACEACLPPLKKKKHTLTIVSPPPAP